MSDDLTIYMFILSPYSRTVVNVAKLLDIKHKEKSIDLNKNEQKKKWYKEINPKGQVPCIVDGDTKMAESLDICKYFIESRKKQTSLWPADDKDKQAQIEEDLKISAELAPVNKAASFTCFWTSKLGQGNPTEDERQKALGKEFLNFDILNTGYSNF